MCVKESTSTPTPNPLTNPSGSCYGALEPLKLYVKCHLHISPEGKSKFSSDVQAEPDSQGNHWFTCLCDGVHGRSTEKS